MRLQWDYLYNVLNIMPSTPYVLTKWLVRGRRGTEWVWRLRVWRVRKVRCLMIKLENNILEGEERDRIRNLKYYTTQKILFKTL